PAPAGAGGRRPRLQRGRLRHGTGRRRAAGRLRDGRRRARGAGASGRRLVRALDRPGAADRRDALRRPPVASVRLLYNEHDEGERGRAVTDSRPCGGGILVVGDDEGLRTSIAAVLGAAGFGVELAADGHEALAVAREHLVQAVVLDVCLPGLSGYEVCRTLKEARPDLPILFLS